eukprot:8745361-Pyramimonas_sp.AAC.1
MKAWEKHIICNKVFHIEFLNCEYNTFISARTVLSLAFAVEDARSIGVHFVPFVATTRSTKIDAPRNSIKPLFRSAQHVKDPN